MRVALVLLLVSLLLVPVAGARPSTLVGFRMPSRNIACALEPALGGAPAVLRCDILSGLRPEPRRSCELDWTGLTLGRIGRAHPTCAGDTVNDPGTPILRYGHRWRRGGFACTSRRTGLTCRNRAGHGFFLAREHWRTF